MRRSTEMMNSEEVLEGIHKIFQNRFSMDIDFKDSSQMHSHLLGSIIGMTPGDLIYLFFDIEKEFGITISEEDILSGSFSTIHGIIDIISSHYGNIQLPLTGS